MPELLNSTRLKIQFLAAAVMVVLLGCSDVEKKGSPPSRFVSLQNNMFYLNGKPFYPIALNYLATLQASSSGDVWASSFNGYNPSDKYLYTTKDSSLLQLKAEMDLIKEMGFNTIRLVRIGEETVDDPVTGKLSFRARINNGRDTILGLDNPNNYLKYLDALKEFFMIADKAGLKVIFLVNVQPDVASTEKHLAKVAGYFKNSDVIMAYDLFNEPLYFDPKQRDKTEVHEITKRWKNILRSAAPDQLFTIGLEGIREVFEWDPNILEVDFVSLHPYEYEHEQVRNEIYWYGKYITKPWIIGETAISADNDSVSYEEQRKFAFKTLRQAHNCGAIGYSWWQYKDVDWHLFHANYMGVVNWKGHTRTKTQNILLEGTPKPLIKEFQAYAMQTPPKDTCLCFQNYYNYTSNHSFRLIGKFTDENNSPIQGAVILGWYMGWTHSYHTISKSDGSFELLSNYPFYHWMASATLFTMIRGEIVPDSANIKAGVKTIDMGVLKLKELAIKN